MFELDIVRILFAFICGHFLCLSGSLSQIVSSNPLASPSTLGFDGLIVLFVLVAHAISSFVFEVPLGPATFVLFLIFLLLLLMMGKIRPSILRQLRMNQVILLGIGFNLLIGAVFAVVQFLYMGMNLQFPSGLWFGNFRAANTQIFIILIPTFVVACWVSWHLAKSLTLINIDMTMARSLGINVSKIQKKSLLLALFLTGSIISFFGVFSFLGLILPHLMRSLPWFKGNIRSELLWAPILAGVLMGVLDQLCYNITFYGAELPVGMVSSVVGSLALVVIVVRKVLS